MGDELPWGRRFLMCPPTHFGVLYEINPWMDRAVVVDRDRALAQWEHLKATLEAAGATIEVQEPVDGVPDIVFTANAGIVHRGVAVPSHFRFPERQGETAVDATWFAEHGFEVRRLPPEVGHEGAGDALPFGGVLLSGHRFRSDQAAGPLLADLLGVEVRPIGLTDARYYHLDITFCPVDTTRALCWAGAWDEAGRQAVAELVPEPLWLEADEAAAFAANSVVVGRTIVMPQVPVRVGRQLEAWGLSPVEVDVSEFLKAGGGCRCLTLALDWT